MKAYITRSSKPYTKGDVKEYKSLKKCINTLLATENFGDFLPELIISRATKGENFDYRVELYDSWRE